MSAKKFVYVVVFIKKSNHSSLLGVFEDESVARLYCRMKKEEDRDLAYRGRLDCRRMELLDGSPELTRYILKTKT